MKKVKNILVQVVDFIIGIIGFYGSVIGISEILKELFGFQKTNSICIILSILFISRVVYLISNSEKN